MTPTKNKYETAKEKGGPLGATILEETKVESHLSIVLAEREVEFVRWWFNHQTGGFFWGHYYRKEPAPRSHLAYQLAKQDFDETVERRKIT